MHELEITRELISMIKAECKKHGLSPRRAVVTVGELTSYKEEPIIYYFNLLKDEELRYTELSININNTEEIKLIELTGDKIVR